MAAQIQRIVATVLQRDVSDPRIDGLVSVTKVEMSPDLREGKVYLSVLGGKRTPKTVLDGVKSAGATFNTRWPTTWRCDGVRG